MLYKKDYFKLSQEEYRQIEMAEQYLGSKKGELYGRQTLSDLSKFHEHLPHSGYYARSLFPNNYITLNYQMHPTSLHSKIGEFTGLLQNPQSNERMLLDYIKRNESYFILESLFYYYDFGHHGSFLFREFELPPNYKVDFLLVGKSSNGYEFVFIEFEHPNEQIVLKDGSLGKAFRNGIKQVEDWDCWIDSNFFSLRNVFKKFQNKDKELPKEFYELDKSRIHYLVLAGRRHHFKDKTYRLKRKGINNIIIKHYDNLLDAIDFYLDAKLKIKHHRFGYPDYIPELEDK
jgi:hypothetical protein